MQSPLLFTPDGRKVLSGQEDATPEEMAQERNLSVNAILLAKSFVLSRLRLEGKNILDGGHFPDRFVPVWSFTLVLME